MVKYISTRGSVPPVGFDTAVLKGFAEDGGLFVPEFIPKLSGKHLQEFSGLSYQETAFKILSLFIDRAVIPEKDLRYLIRKSYNLFEHPDVMPLTPINNEKTLFSMELFHGPTLSFKDIAMGFLLNTMEYFLNRDNECLSLILATTGDTGPAAAWAAAGKSFINCWPLYPAGMISREQERQMTTLHAVNIHPVSVENCRDGGDDIDKVVARLFSDPGQVRALNLSSVNSINWCRVLVQAVHYAYAYFRVCDQVGEPIDFCVPSGAFGNLFAGFLARKIGIPIRTLICANNENKTLHTVFTTGVFKKEDLQTTLSSAIDIVVPYNFWRFLYFVSEQNPVQLSQWMDEFEENGKIVFDRNLHSRLKQGFASMSVTDEQTLDTMKETWEEMNYLTDPHTAVAVHVAKRFMASSRTSHKMICLATAHPAKFPDVVKQALGVGGAFPQAAMHSSITDAENLEEAYSQCDISALENYLINEIGNRKAGGIPNNGGLQ